MNFLHQAVISTLAYYRLFNFPLTKFEIFKFLSNPYATLSFGHSIKEIFGAIDNLANQNIILEKQGFYFLDKERDYVSLRLKRQKIAIKKWRKVKKAIYFLQIVPFIRMIGITGSLSISNTRPQSDLDLLIITSPGRIWTTRFLTSVFLYVLGKKRHNQKIASRACLNTFVSQDSLKMAHQDLYSAHEYVQLAPVSGLMVYQEFLSRNTWIKKYLYRLNPGNLYHLRLIKENKIFKITANFIECVLRGKFGNLAEEILAYFQKLKIKKNIKGQIVFKNSCLIFHPQPKSQWVKRRLSTF